MTHSTAKILLLAGALVGAAACDAPSAENDPTLEAFAAGSSDVVISQIYGGGGNSGAPWENDYVELFNRGSAAVSVAGWSVQYASSTGSSWSKTNLTGSIPAGGYYLIVLGSSGSAGSTISGASVTGTLNLSGTSGKVALVTNQTALTCSTSCVPSSSIRDFVGYGSANGYEGSPAAAFSTTTAGYRASAGCSDTDNNSTDFSSAAPVPRTASSPQKSCSGVQLPDAGTTPPVDAGGGGGGSGSDGTPTRVACTGSFGSGMSATYGRLDGYLVSIVNINGSSSCRGDDNHLHLQVKVNNKVQDIAVNVESTSGSPDVLYRTLNHALVGGAWAEGWHTGQTLDYANSLGVKSTSFTAESITQLQSLLDSALANANHISVYATGFDSTGGHDIHRNPTNHDGAIVINPTTSNPTFLLFHFSDQTF